MPHQQSLLIVGASARAAAFSALRAGMAPVCADLFADVDLAARCAVHRIDPRNYPHGFLDLPQLREPGPWLYTGGLENRPDLIEEMARRRQPLWGNSASVLRGVRSPFAVRDVLTRAGLPCPLASESETPQRADRQWLLKPLAGAGGTGIRSWGPTATPPTRPRLFYFQEFIEGEACAAIYLGDGQSARLLGVTRQLVGEPWLHAAPFHYCGSVGPIVLDPAARQMLADIGAALAVGFRLRGLFGIDCILRDGMPYSVEVNPRYTASIEVLEYATGLRALELHQVAFSASGEASAPRCGPHTGGLTPPRSPVVGKAILFARAPLLFPGLDIVPAFADIPQPGTLIDKGRPILTLFRQAATVAKCIDQLRRLAVDLDRWLFNG